MYAARQKSFFSKLGGIDGFVGFLNVPFTIGEVLSRENVLDLFSSFQSFKDIDHINDLIFNKYTLRKVNAL